MVYYVIYGLLMDALKHYITNVLGLEINFTDTPPKALEKLPFFIKRGFKFKYATLLGRELLLLELPGDQDLTVAQIEKHLVHIRQVFDQTLVIVVKDISAITRRRLIEKRINFVVPGKQLYIPAVLLDLKETFQKVKAPADTILPSAQVILIYRILQRNERLEDFPLKILAKKLNYTPMAISKAVADLKDHKLCDVTGTKEKFVHFFQSIPELWERANRLLTTPVLKQVYVDNLPKGISLMRSNTSALPEYTDMSESAQQYRAIEKGLFYSYQKRGELINPNEFEGRFCLEVWKYDPRTLAGEVTADKNIDPISLYLTLRNTNDERIQMALQKIIEQFVW